jgi:Cu(I)/Ag(I) efflux system membrane fusion protein
MFDKRNKTLFSLTACTLITVGAFFLAFPLNGCKGKASDVSSQQGNEIESQTQVLYWTCSMHPQIKQPKPGLCPLCAMDLIPVMSSGSSTDEGPREITLSENAIKLAEIRVAPVERKAAAAEIRMLGKITYDETRLASIAAWVPGRIDRLFVNFTGIQVEKGEPMALMYSPELVSAQEEYLIALRTDNQLLINASRKRLLLFGITERQVEEIEKEGKTKNHLTIYAPLSGVVIHKNGLEGMYVETGTQIYAIADLSQVWVLLDAYESDLMWIRKGQRVKIETEAYPGETYDGTIVFIDPFLDPKTRTTKVRVNVPNPQAKLKPEMFVRALVLAVDKTKKERAQEAPLVIPATAPLFTGKRAVVYVQVPGKKGAFEGREVALGPRVGDAYIVRDGLVEGEQVVVNGNFKIDSAIQILAKPSMMSPEGGGQPPGHDHGTQQKKPTSEGGEETFESFVTPESFKSQLDGVFSAYFMIHQTLSKDDLKGAQDNAEKLLASLENVDMKLLEGPAHMAWMKEHKSITSSAQLITGSKGIETGRSAFITLSDSLYKAAKQLGTIGTQRVLRFYCSMAAGGKGAYWLQNKTGTENPYYGSAMFKCGEQVEVITPGHNSELSGGKGHD